MIIDWPLFVSSFCPSGDLFKPVHSEQPLLSHRLPDGRRGKHGTAPTSNHDGLRRTFLIASLSQASRRGLSLPASSDAACTLSTHADRRRNSGGSFLTHPREISGSCSKFIQEPQVRCAEWIRALQPSLLNLPRRLCSVHQDNPCRPPQPLAPSVAKANPRKMTAEIAEERTVQGSTRAPSRSSRMEEKQLDEKPEFETTLDATKPGDPEAQQVAQAPKPEFPEGGLRGWATVAGACVPCSV